MTDKTYTTAEVEALLEAALSVNYHNDSPFYTKDPVAMSRLFAAAPTIARQFVEQAKEIERLRAIEPTKEMIDHGAQAVVSWEEGSVWPDSWSQTQVNRARRFARNAYIAMRCNQGVPRQLPKHKSGGAQ